MSKKYKREIPNKTNKMLIAQKNKWVKMCKIPIKKEKKHAKNKINE
jgi:hypothetical protein